MNPPCKKMKLEVIRETVKTDNVQSISLQEPLETSRNQTPTILRGKIDGNLIGEVFIGQRKRITGVYRSELDLKKIHDKYFDKSGMKQKGKDIIKKGLKGLK